MVITRTGMEKILNFEKKHGLFLPYDLELTFIPGIHAINLKPKITSPRDDSSDTASRMPE